eukprot:7269198-Prymnesium_polylepis.1
MARPRPQRRAARCLHTWRPAWRPRGRRRRSPAARAASRRPRPCRRGTARGTARSRAASARGQTGWAHLAGRGASLHARAQRAGAPRQW